MVIETDELLADNAARAASAAKMTADAASAGGPTSSPLDDELPSSAAVNYFHDTKYSEISKRIPDKCITCSGSKLDPFRPIPAITTSNGGCNQIAKQDTLTKLTASYGIFGFASTDNAKQSMATFVAKSGQLFVAPTLSAVFEIAEPFTIHLQNGDSAVIVEPDRTSSTPPSTSKDLTIAQWMMAMVQKLKDDVCSISMKAAYNDKIANIAADQTAITDAAENKAVLFCFGSAVKDVLEKYKNADANTICIVAFPWKTDVISKRDETAVWKLLGACIASGNMTIPPVSADANKDIFPTEFILNTHSPNLHEFEKDVTTHAAMEPDPLTPGKNYGNLASDQNKDNYTAWLQSEFTKPEESEAAQVNVGKFILQKGTVLFAPKDTNAFSLAINTDDFCIPVDDAGLVNAQILRLAICMAKDKDYLVSLPHGAAYGYDPENEGETLQQGKPNERLPVITTIGPIQSWMASNCPDENAFPRLGEHYMSTLSADTHNQMVTRMNETLFNVAFLKSIADKKGRIIFFCINWSASRIMQRLCEQNKNLQGVYVVCLTYKVPNEEAIHDEGVLTHYIKRIVQHHPEYERDVQYESYDTVTFAKDTDLSAKDACGTYASDAFTHFRALIRGPADDVVAAGELGKAKADKSTDEALFRRWVDLDLTFPASDAQPGDTNYLPKRLREAAGERPATAWAAFSYLPVCAEVVILTALLELQGVDVSVLTDLPDRIKSGDLWEKEGARPADVVASVPDRPVVTAPASMATAVTSVESLAPVAKAVTSVESLAPAATAVTSVQSLAATAVATMTYLGKTYELTIGRNLREVLTMARIPPAILLYNGDVKIDIGDDTTVTTGRYEAYDIASLMVHNGMGIVYGDRWKVPKKNAATIFKILGQILYKDEDGSNELTDRDVLALPDNQTTSLYFLPTFAIGYGNRTHFWNWQPGTTAADAAQWAKGHFAINADTKVLLLNEDDNRVTNIERYGKYTAYMYVDVTAAITGESVSGELLKTTDMLAAKKYLFSQWKGNTAIVGGHKSANGVNLFIYSQGDTSSPPATNYTSVKEGDQVMMKWV